MARAPQMHGGSLYGGRAAAGAHDRAVSSASRAAATSHFGGLKPLVKRAASSGKGKGAGGGSSQDRDRKGRFT